MLDQNTDRMWYVIGAVLVGAAIILIANGTLPEIFASVTESFESVVAQFSDNENLLKEWEAVGGWLNHEGVVESETPNPRSSRDWTSGFIEVEDADYITFSTNGRHQTKRAMFYDEKREPMLPRMANTEPLDTVMVYVVPEGAKYIRVSGMNWASGYFKVEHGRYATGEIPEPIEPYFGRNLLLNSSNFAQGYIVNGEGINVSITKEGYLKVVAEEGNTGTVYLPELDKSNDHIHTFQDDILSDNGQVSLSLQVKSPDYVSDYQKLNPKVNLKQGMVNTGYFGLVRDEWRTLYRPYMWDEKSELEVSIAFNELEGTFYFRDPKLDIGSVTTPYSKAPED